MENRGIISPISDIELFTVVSLKGDAIFFITFSVKTASTLPITVNFLSVKFADCNWDLLYRKLCSFPITRELLSLIKIVSGNNPRKATAESLNI